MAEDGRGQPVWTFEGTGGQVSFDPRVLEVGDLREVSIWDGPGATTATSATTAPPSSPPSEVRAPDAVGRGPAADRVSRRGPALAALGALLLAAVALAAAAAFRRRPSA